MMNEASSTNHLRRRLMVRFVREQILMIQNIMATCLKGSCNMSRLDG